MSVSPTGLLCFVSSFLIDGYGQNYTDRHRRWFLAVIIFYIGLAVTLSCPRRGKWAQVSLARSLLSIMMMMAMCWWWWWRSSSLLTNQHHHADYKEDDDVCVVDDDHWSHENYPFLPSDHEEFYWFDSVVILLQCLLSSLVNIWDFLKLSGI